jgi:hypothetical protein
MSPLPSAWPQQAFAIPRSPPASSIRSRWTPCRPKQRTPYLSPQLASSFPRSSRFPLIEPSPIDTRAFAPLGPPPRCHRVKFLALPHHWLLAPLAAINDFLLHLTLRARGSGMTNSRPTNPLSPNDRRQMINEDRHATPRVLSTRLGRLLCRFPSRRALGFRLGLSLRATLTRVRPQLFPPRAYLGRLNVAAAVLLDGPHGDEVVGYLGAGVPPMPLRDQIHI